MNHSGNSKNHFGKRIRRIVNKGPNIYVHKLMSCYVQYSSQDSNIFNLFRLDIYGRINLSIINKSNLSIPCNFTTNYQLRTKDLMIFHIIYPYDPPYTLVKVEWKLYRPKIINFLFFYCLFAELYHNSP